MMKRLALTMLIAGFIVSCSHDVEFGEIQTCTEELLPETEQFPQRWRLVRMGGSMINSVTEGEAMSWQEVIELNADNTFKKTRKREGKTKMATGTYSISNDPTYDIVLLILSYSSGKDLIGSCTNIESETYSFASKCKLFGTWSACDGPSLEYERQVNNTQEVK